MCYLYHQFTRLGACRAQRSRLCSSYFYIYRHKYLCQFVSKWPQAELKFNCIHHAIWWNTDHHVILSSLSIYVFIFIYEFYIAINLYIYISICVVLPWSGHMMAKFFELMSFIGVGRGQHGVLREPVLCIKAVAKPFPRKAPTAADCAPNTRSLRLAVHHRAFQ